MLHETFLHLPGISGKTQDSWKAQGIADWDELIAARSIKGVGAKRLALYKQLAKASKAALQAQDALFFAALLPSAEHHLAYGDFKDTHACLDLEVDRHGEVTVVTITDGLRTSVLLKDVNLNLGELKRALLPYKLLITFNGAAFDLPLLRKRYGLHWKGLHIDLKTAARRLGYEGGLKAIERTLGITRDYEEKYHVILKGGDPAQLYRMWRGSGDDYYLDLLLEYNEADALHTWLVAHKLLAHVKT